MSALRQRALSGQRTAKLPVPPLPPVMSSVSAEVTFSLSCSARNAVQPDVTGSQGLQSRAGCEGFACAGRGRSVNGRDTRMGQESPGVTRDAWHVTRMAEQTPAVLNSVLGKAATGTVQRTCGESARLLTLQSVAAQRTVIQHRITHGPAIDVLTNRIDDAYSTRTVTRVGRQTHSSTLPDTSRPHTCELLMSGTMYFHRAACTATGVG
jgi:hypothetical protein